MARRIHDNADVTPTSVPAIHGDRDVRGRFLTGNKGGGRPKGCRNKLGEEFIDAVYRDWQEHGVTALARVREERPDAYIRMIAALLPRQVAIEATNTFEGIETTVEIIEAVRQELGDADAEALAALVNARESN